VFGRPLGVQCERRCSRLVSMFARSPRKRPARMAPDTWATSASVGNRTLMIGVDRLEESSYNAFAVVAVRMSALRLSAAISPSMPAFFKMAANSERRVATSLIAPSR
jgi:hypothetical protein